MGGGRPGRAPVEFFLPNGARMREFPPPSPAISKGKQDGEEVFICDGGQKACNGNPFAHTRRGMAQPLKFFFGGAPNAAQRATLLFLIRTAPAHPPIISLIAKSCVHGNGEIYFGWLVFGVSKHFPFKGRVGPKGAPSPNYPCPSAGAEFS